MRLELQRDLLAGQSESFPDARIEYLEWNGSGLKLAVFQPITRQMLLFDGQTLEKREKFSIKSAASSSSNQDDEGSTQGWIKAIAFSPDSKRMAIAHSESMIHVYRIGQQWGEKKSIAAKYALQAPPMHLVWTASGLVFTSMDRKIKLIEPNQNRMVPLVESSASFQVAAIACADYPGQSILVVGWTDGSIQSIQIDAANRNEGQTLFRWTSVQFALCVSTSMRTICSGGSDGRLHFLPLIGLKSASATIDSNQSARQTIDLHAQIDCVASSMSGDLVVAATVNRLFLFGGTVVSRSTSNVATHRLKSAPSSASGGIWTLIREVSLTGAPLSRLCLAPDGSRILCASTSGAVHVLKISWRTVRIKGGHQISYVGRNQINVRLVEINQSDRVTSIRSQYSIVKVRVLANRFVVVWTSGSLIFAGWRTSDELTNNSQLKQPPEIAPAESQPIVAELKWNRADEKLRFCFDFDNVILLQSGSELHVLQWNTSELLASVRTQHFSPHLLSVRLQERDSETKTLAFLVDERTICVLDLASGHERASIHHDQSFDWLELNESADKLLFRDRTQRLFLIRLHDPDFNPICLLTSCGFVQWVPFSDVFVGQQHDELHVFYDSQRAQVYSLPVGCQAIGIERGDGQSWVQLDDTNVERLPLNETLLELDAALQQSNLRRALQLLEQSDTSGNGTGQQQTLIWRRLAEEAVQRDQLDIAERAFAAAGDLVNAAFVRRCVSDRSDVALLSGNFEAYESANSFDHVIDTYKRLQMWNEAIVFAEKQQQIERATELRSEYAKQLMESGDRVKAAELAEQTGDYSEAIRLYMSCNHLLAATRCVRRHDRQVSASIRDQLIDRLKQKRMYAAAGELYEMQAQQSSASSDCLQQALQCYEMGEHYEQCVRLARNHFPADVVRFEKVFGQQLAARGRPAASISHLIEAGETALALESALAADRLQQAADLAIALGESIESDLCQRVAERLVTSGQVQKAVQVCVQCGRCTEAVQLLLRQGLYEMAFKVARERMSVEQVNDQFERLSRTLVTDEKLAEAEQVLVAAGLIDQAVQIYRQAHQYESMLRLVARHKPNQLMDTRLALASELAALGRLEEAETHFVAANQWKAAVQAYSRVGQWSNAYRLARAYGGAEGASQVAFVWARECDSAADAVQLLDRLKQLEPVLEQAQASGAFEFALAVAQSAPQLKGHVSQVQTRWAVALQKQGKRDAAESLWLDAGKLREAVTMRLQANEFDQALVLADRFGRDVSLWRDVCTAYLRYTLSGTNGEMLRSAAGIEPLAASVETIVSRVEQLSIRASRPEMALNLLLENRWFQRAANFASNHAPHLIDTVQRATTIGNKSSAGDSSIEDRDPSDRPIVSRRTSTSNQPIDHETLQQLSDKLIQISRHGTREQLLTAANALARAQKQLGQWNQSLRTLQQHAAVFLMPDARLLLLDIGRVLFTIQSFSDDEISDWKLLRDVLTAAYNSTEQSIGAESDPLIDEQISHQLQLAHYLHLKSVLANIGRNPIAGEIHDKICISILRYTNLLRVDWAFFQAGLACIDNDRIAMAFVFLNHFLDLIDAIEQQNPEIDHSDLDGTDIPEDVPLPDTVFCVQHASVKFRFSGQSLPDSHVRQPIVTPEYESSAVAAFQGEQLIEQVRAWILSKSMDAQEAFRLPLDKSSGRFESCLLQPNGGSSLPCVVTGYPVRAESELELKSGIWAANKEDWNKLITIAKMSANEQLKDCVQFVGRWCANSSMVNRLTFQ